jgi:hypothetical protein
MGDPAGEADTGALRLDFDRRLLLQFRGSAITSVAGLLAYRELDDTLSLTDTGAETLADARTGKNGRHRLGGLLRQSVFGRLAGYEDVNDAERLCRDPAMRWVVGDRATTGSAASVSQMGGFETKWLSRLENLAALADLPGHWIDPAAATAQDHRARHGFERKPDLWRAGGQRLQRTFRLYLLPPAVCVQPVRRCRALLLRPGNVHSAADWRPMLEPVIARYRGTVKRLYFRGDAAFANPEMYEFLEAEGAGYAMRRKQTFARYPAVSGQDRASERLGQRQFAVVRAKG